MKISSTSSKSGSGYLCEVTSVSSFLAIIEREKEIELKEGNSSDFIFRGQQCDFPLIPKIRRLHPKVHDLAKLEKLMMADFERQMLLFTEKEPRDKWDLLALARHHGLPTRLFRLVVQCSCGVVVLRWARSGPDEDWRHEERSGMDFQNTRR
jgi:hypothetical protein